ncbi:MAG: efflux RND transporter periplasmic adaptor subunit [Candidatus Baltobacteraceae bacterium]
MSVLRTLSAAALASAMLAGCGGQKQQRGPMALDVDVAQAQRHDIATFLTLDGQISPLQESTLSFQQSGPVSQIDVNQGDRVSSGEMLARIDASTLQAQLAQVQAQIAQSASQAQSSALNVPITQANTSQAVQSAKAALDNAKLTYDQDTQLFRQGYVSQSQLEQARSAYVAAQSQYGTALSNRGTTGVQNAQAQAAQGAVKAAQAQADILRTEIGQTALYAPFDGVVTARLMDPGAMASPGTPVLRVSQIDTVWLNVNVPDEDLSYVHAGTPVTFSTSQLGGRTFTGRVSTVNAVPTQGTLSYQARIRQPNPGDVLRGGMLVNVTIEKIRHKGVIVVPRAAVAQTDQGANVFIVTGKNKAQEVPVQVGVQTDTLSEVHSPRVTAGTLVITTRPDALQNGSTVAIVGGRRGQ